jgi:transcriptional regulator with XRE-family HTH domain
VSRRTRVRVVGDRETQAIVARLGREIRDWREHHGLTLAQLGARVGLGASRMGDIERGEGGEASFSTYVALGIAIGRPLAAMFSKGVEPAATRDGGHLPIQELMLGLGRRHGRARTFELPTRSLRSVDVGLRDDRFRVLILNEIWNRIDDVGAAKRDSDRKVDEVRQHAIATNDPPYRVASCWVLRATAANRALVARYPNVFESAFPGSSRAWVRALVDGAEPPTHPGLVWADVAGTRLFEWRRASRP